MWKINSIPTISEIIFLIDPFAALINTWAFCLQQVQFFEEGRGKDLFGDHQSIAIIASRKIENEMREYDIDNMLRLMRKSYNGENKSKGRADHRLL